MSQMISDMFDTMPKRVVVLATIASMLILAIAGFLLAYLYNAHELREFDALLLQDKQIVAQRFDTGHDGTLVHAKTGTETLYDRHSSEWVWQLFERTPDENILLQQSESLGAITDTSPALSFPIGGFADFTSHQGIALRGALSDVTLLGESNRYLIGIAGPSLHVVEEVEEAVSFIIAIFAALAIALGLLVYSIVRSGLRPLTRLQSELEAMRAGHGVISNNDWPADLQPIVEELRELDGRINSLVDRHRRQASDLAHSLKTPLAILSKLVTDLTIDERIKIEEQTDRITTAVRRNLSRLRTGAITSTSTPVHETVEEVVFALEVLFRERSLDIRNRIGNDVTFRGDPDDLREIVGNLLDNACKWATSKIVIDCKQTGSFLVLSVSDDGPGFENTDTADKKEAQDLRHEAEFVSGVGLLIVEDIAALYGGRTDIKKSALGGAEISVELPASPPLEVSVSAG